MMAVKDRPAVLSEAFIELAYLKEKAREAHLINQAKITSPWHKQT